MSVTFYSLLLIVGSISLSVAADPVNKPSFLSMLESDAVKVCIPDVSLYLDKDLPEQLNHSLSRFVCPLHCAATQLGIVNDVGANKLIVQWIREMPGHYVQQIKEVYNGTLPPELQADVLSAAVTRYSEVWWNSSAHMAIGLKEACSASDEMTRENLVKSKMREVEDLYSYFHITHPKLVPSTFVPSNDESPLLEAVYDADVTCKGKYNVSMTKTAVVFQITEAKKPAKQHFCYAHCLFSQLELIDENGMNAKVMEMSQKVLSLLPSNEAAEQIRSVVNGMNVTVPMMASKCLHQYDETPEDYFTSSACEHTTMPLYQMLSSVFV